jgi:hypothetical protein
MAKELQMARRLTMTARELKPKLERLSWRRLTEIYVRTRSQAVRRMIEKEARRCGYRMSGFILADTLNRQSR